MNFLSELTSKKNRPATDAGKGCCGGKGANRSLENFAKLEPIAEKLEGTGDPALRKLAKEAAKAGDKKRTDAVVHLLADSNDEKIALEQYAQKDTKELKALLASYRSNVASAMEWMNWAKDNKPSNMTQEQFDAYTIRQKDYGEQMQKHVDAIEKVLWERAADAKKTAQDGSDAPSNGETLEEHLKHCKAKDPATCPFQREASRQDDMTGAAASGQFPDDDDTGVHAHFEYDPADIKSIKDLTEATEKVNQKVEQGDATPNVEVLQTLMKERTALLTLASRHEEYKQVVLDFITAGETGFTSKLAAVPQPVKAKAEMVAA